MACLRLGLAPCPRTLPAGLGRMIETVSDWSGRRSAADVSHSVSQSGKLARELLQRIAKLGEAS